MTTITDLFAGAGGSSTGATQAGVTVRLAANHWQTAIDTHQLNHPGADHDCADISQTDPSRYPRTDLLWASPSCTHHSRAQGKRRTTGPAEFAPHRGRVEWGEVRQSEPDRSRATMFDVIRFAEHHRYDGIIVENVPEVREWPLYRWWLSAVTDGLGYREREDIVSAARCNQLGDAAPQDRRRLYVQFWRGSVAPKPIWQAEVMPGALTILDEDPGPLIEDRPRPLSNRTMARIKATVDRHPHERRMIVSYYGASKVGRAGREPLPTLTTHDRHAVITRCPDGLHYRMLTVAEQAAAMGFPGSYRFCGNRADQVKQIGNAVCPPAARDIVAGLVDACGQVAA